MNSTTPTPQAKKTYRLMTHGVLKPNDQVLYADFQQDCEAKRRWHRVPAHRVGFLISGILKHNPDLKFRRLTP